MSAVVAGILFAVAVFFSSAFAEEMKTMSLYLEQDERFVWLDGDTSRISTLAEVLVAKNFVAKPEGPKKVLCIVDTFAILRVGEERGTVVTCGESSNLDVLNNDPQYIEKVVEYIDWFFQYVRSPFTGEAEKNEVSLRSDQERSCVFLETKEFKKDKEGSRLYESQSHARLVLLQQSFEKRGYVEKQANWTLCNAVFAKRRCVITMDHIEGRQLMPLETIINCYTADRTKVLDGSVKNNLPIEEYVGAVLNMIQEEMDALLDVDLKGEDKK